MLASSGDFKMQTGDAKVHLGVANQRETATGFHLRHSTVSNFEQFKEETLLIDSCRGQQGCLNALTKPSRTVI